MKKIYIYILLLACVLTSKSAYAWDLIGFSGSISTLEITGNQMFDYFFTLVCFFGLVSFLISAIVKVVSRS
ncbi:MAG: hypothetical protein A2Y97_06595 [Nitrospirae bacterium RBG_13_39_12]|nr:MAG: hypothetical protein A2Y97_06595 [Nitrospirae bacterium RBG_13_39_12]